MKQGFIKAAAATPRVTVADCRANGAEILRLIHEMEKEKAKLMVFPELSITGYTCGDLFLQRSLLDSAWETLLWLAGDFRGTSCACVRKNLQRGGSPEQRKDSWYCAKNPPAKL
mgnify:CR=1 FL=1